MPAQGKVNVTRLVDGDVILVQLTRSGRYIPAARATADGVIPAVVVRVDMATTDARRTGRLLTVRLYGKNGIGVNLTDTYAEVGASPSQTVWWANHFATWRNAGVPASVDLATV